MVCFKHLLIIATLTQISTSLKSYSSKHEVGHSSRTPAGWNDAVPDYSMLELGATPFRILQTLVFLDEKTANHYGHVVEDFRAPISELIQEANAYFVQFRIGIVLVGILQTRRSDLNLYSFQEYRNQRLHKLPHHDFAVLMSYSYSGGLAFVNGMCTSTSVMLCGFFPHKPSAMGSIFFHEVAHLLGVPHKDANATLKVPNCKCKAVTAYNVDEPCLRIPAFDHDCTAQQLANVIYKNRCLKIGNTMERSLSICGNGVVEEGEQCDCGLAEQCGSSWNCVPMKCEYRLHPFFVGMIVSLFLLGILFILFLIGYYKGIFKGFHRKANMDSKSFKTNLAKSQSFLNFTSSPYFVKKPIHASQVSPSSIVVLLDGSVLGTPNTGTKQRPRLPPPPPPSQILAKSKISVQMPSNVYEIPRTQDSRQYIADRDELDNLSWKFEDFDSDEDMPPAPIYSGQIGVPTIPNNGLRSPINRVTVQYRGGSDNTISTPCPSNSNSDASLIC